MKRQFYPCSGQKTKTRKNDWGIHSRALPPYWRARDKMGRQRSFKTFEDAEKAAVKMEREARVC